MTDDARAKLPVAALVALVRDLPAALAAAQA